MYQNVTGNIHAVCMVTGKPVYHEAVGEKRVEMTTVYAQCKEMSADGVMTVNLSLLFFGNLAIPAMKINQGHTIVIDGRESSKEFRKKTENGKQFALQRSVVVEAWRFREIDPGGILQELSIRREIAAREKELKETFSEWLCMCKGTIMGWFIDWFKENIEAVKLKEKDGDNKA